MGALQATRALSVRPTTPPIGTAAAVPTPAQPLYAVLDQLDSALRDLHGEIGELGERLEPVLVPAPPDGAATGTDVSYNAGVIVSRVESTVLGVRQALTRLEALRGRVVV